MEEFITNALAKWRKERDEQFVIHGLDLNEVYSKGMFEELPPLCLMAVCYVDAYNCMLGFIENEKES